MFWKSSAKHLATRRISQKCFVDLDFGHRSCPFLRIFSSLVQSRFRNITKLIYIIIDKNESIMVSQKMAPKKPIYLIKIFWHVTHQNAYFLFYQLKREICNLATIIWTDDMYHIIMHATIAHELCVHIFVLSIKQNICWHHTTIKWYDYAARNTVSIS